MNDRHGVLMIFYDLPSLTADQQREYRHFRKSLIRSGFRQMQESVYVKLVRSVVSVASEIHQIRSGAPKGSDVRALPMTLNDFRKLETLSGSGFDLPAFSDDVVFPCEEFLF